jgi:hypothetical protein
MDNETNTDGLHMKLLNTQIAAVNAYPLRTLLFSHRPERKAMRKVDKK